MTSRQKPPSSPHDDAETATVEAVIRHHVAALNSGDRAAIASDWAPEGVLVDAFPPFCWAGPAPTDQWWRDLESTLRPTGLDKVTFSLHGWQRFDVTHAHAYAVANASALISGPAFAVEAKGTWTFVLHRINDTWRIVSWNWGGPPATPLQTTA